MLMIRPYYQLQIPGDYDANMDHVDLIEAQVTKEGMLAYDSIEEASIAALPGDDLVSEKILFRCTERQIRSAGI